MINEYLPHARPCEQRVVPVSARPGLVNPEIPPAMLCRVSVTKKDSQGETKTFSQERWVVQGKPTRMGITGTLDGKPFQEPVELSYGFQAVNLGFELELTRAESQVDPGTTRSATYTSFVKLYDPERGIRGEERMITMNEPLPPKQINDAIPAPLNALIMKLLTKNPKRRSQSATEVSLALRQMERELETESAAEDVGAELAALAQAATAGGEQAQPQ